MLLAWISRLIASLLVAVLSATIIMLVLNQTVLNSHYLEGQLAATNSYSRLSTGLSEQVAKDTGSVDPAVTAGISKILTPDVIKARLNSFLDQLQAYYQGKGALPVLDFSDLAAEARAAGIPLGNDTTLTQPIKFGDTDSTDRQVNHSYHNSPALGVVASIVLALLLALLCWKRRKYQPLANVLISIGVLIGLFALFLWSSPGLFDHYVKFNTASNAITGVTHDVLSAIAHDLGKRFGIIAISSLVLGIGLRVLIRRLTTVKLKAPPSVPSSRSNLSR